MASKQSEYKTIIRLAGMIDPSYTRAMREASIYAKQFAALDTKGKAKEIGIIAAGMGMQLAGKAISAGAKLAAQGMGAMIGYVKESIPLAAEYGSQMRQVAKFTDGFRDSQNKLTEEYHEFYNELLTKKSIYTPAQLAEIAAQNAKAQIPAAQLSESVDLKCSATLNSERNASWRKRKE